MVAWGEEEAVEVQMEKEEEEAVVVVEGTICWSR